MFHSGYCITIKDIDVLDKFRFPNLTQIRIKVTVNMNFVPIPKKKIFLHNFLSVASFVENKFLINRITVEDSPGQDLKKLNCSSLELSGKTKNFIEVNPNVKMLSLTSTPKIRKIKFKPDLQIDPDSKNKIKSLKMPYGGCDNYIKDHSYHISAYIRRGNKFISKYEIFMHYRKY
jgi:hypothetical protein